MARNTQVDSGPSRAALTQILAKFVASHPSRGWSDAVEHEAHRTFSTGSAAQSARPGTSRPKQRSARVRMLQPAPQSSVLGRADKVDMASAALVNGITSHTFDFDDTHLQDDHPSRRTGRFGAARARRSTGASGAR